MRTRFLTFLVLALFACAKLAYSKRTIVSADSLEGFEEPGSGDEDAASDGHSPVPVQATQLDVNTGRRLGSEALMTDVDALPPLRTQARISKAAGAGPSMHIQVGAEPIETVYPQYGHEAPALNLWYGDDQQGQQPTAPAPHPKLAHKRVREMQKAQRKSRRSRDEEAEEAQAQAKETRQRPATPISPHRQEGEGRRWMVLRSDVARAKKMRPTSPAMRPIQVPVRQASLIPGIVAGDLATQSSRAAASHRSSTYSFLQAPHPQAGAPSGTTADQQFQVTSHERAIVPAEMTPVAIQAPHARRAAGSTPERFQAGLREPAAVAQDGGETSSDGFLHSLFQNYRSFPQPSGFHTRTAPFYVNGIRYGPFTSQPRLPDPPALAHRDPHAGSATVLLPDDVRWTFGQVGHRHQAYGMARDHAYSSEIRRAMAREAHRLYEMEANQLRSNIYNRNELPLQTSDEWRHWIASNGPNVLMSHLDPARMADERDVALVQAQHRLALRIQSTDLERGQVIPLMGEHEKFAANSLVALWTSGKDEALKLGGMGPIV